MRDENNERPVELNTPYIELDKLLKREDLAASGGEARYLISEGLVKVNGLVETRKRKKLYTDDIVEFNGTRLRVIGTTTIQE
ncbi:MAG: RNA-binding S4 domain-containing protein [Desulfobulbus sp.]|nr:RNA-binding S4 domain-containing protein [Desulfobulbus sp.]